MRFGWRPERRFASAPVNNGLSIYDVKELFGYASINMTQRCAHLSQDRLAQATETVAGHYGSKECEGGSLHFKIEA
jgi:hypothetical protein